MASGTRHARGSRRGPRIPAAVILLTVAALVAAVVGLNLGREPLARSAEGPTAAEPTTRPGSEPTTEAPSSPPQGSEDEDVELTILSAGDVLPHESVNRAAETAQGWDFVPLMSSTRAWTAGADLALCSLEVPIRPPGEQVSAYPVFGAPEELIGSLQELGWDGCTTATNHSMDRGAAGVTHTLDLLDEAGMGHVGTARTPAEAEQPQLYRLERESREVTVAHLAATTSDNGLPAPANQPWMVTSADTGALIEQARRARDDGADLVVVSMHWGTEYVDSPIEEQTRIASALAESGQVDLIFGNHSHTPQPLERLPGGPDGEGMWVAWSMGNFISNQDALCCRMETGTGIMATATVTVPSDGEPRVTGLEWAPVTVDREGGQRIHPLLDLMNGERPDGLTLDEATLQRRWDGVVAVMGEDRLRRQPPESTGPGPEVLPRER
ncbi:CapA family protein [Georgenia deserti]|uniref:CapA family protein n=1 Tax=Georgenia deserti TaxID=2093781 RepID=A0ABW4L862_9MICO